MSSDRDRRKLAAFKACLKALEDVLVEADRVNIVASLAAFYGGKK